jgi:formylglycine-generating enzyme required for sulfatase activity
MARARIEDLKKQQVAVVSPPPVPSPPTARPTPGTKEPSVPGLLDKTIGVVLPAEKSAPVGDCDGIKVAHFGTPQLPVVLECFKPGSGSTKWFKDCPECPEMVVVPAGEFMMGSNAGIGDQRPVHKVTIARPFAVGRFAVTYEEWDACLTGGGCEGYRPPEILSKGGRHPVSGVSWNDARAYVTWLSRKTGKSYRLLSESEWEYVTRAGTKTANWWGMNSEPQPAKTCDRSNMVRQDDRGNTFDMSALTLRMGAVPVDCFVANPWGLHYTYGQLTEWVADCSHENYVGAPADGSAWEDHNTCQRTARQGRESATRWFGAPEKREAAPGLRIARTLTP